MAKTYKNSRYVTRATYQKYAVRGIEALSTFHKCNISNHKKPYICSKKHEMPNELRFTNNHGLEFITCYKPPVHAVLESTHKPYHHTTYLNRKDQRFSIKFYCSFYLLEEKEALDNIFHTCPSARFLLANGDFNIHTIDKCIEKYTYFYVKISVTTPEEYIQILLLGVRDTWDDIEYKIEYPFNKTITKKNFYTNLFNNTLE